MRVKWTKEITMNREFFITWLGVNMFSVNNVIEISKMLHVTHAIM